MPYIICLIAFVISSVTIPSIILLANNNGVIARPGKRHIHTHPTPKFGGIAIAFTVLLISPFFFSFDRVVGSYLLSSALMLLLGIIDDVRGTNWKIKLAFSIVATSIIIFGAGIWVRNLGNLLGFGEIELGIWGIPFTFFAVFGVTNAINLIDGLDGLACGVSSIAFLSFAVFASISGNSTVLYLSLANLGATLGLFRYNYPRARIFMGDSGSLFLGFSIAILAILLTQRQGRIDPMVPVVILGIPIFDTVRVLVIRIKNKRHPFKADNTHLHHLMIRSGIPQKRVVKIIWILSSLMFFLAFVLFTFDSWIILLVLCIVIASIGVFIENLRIIKLSTNNEKPNGKTTIIMSKIQKAVKDPRRAISYLNYQAAKLCGHRTYKKFIVLARSRVGSNMLISMLNSHQSIHAHGEVFQRDNGKIVKDVLNEVFSRYPRNVKAVGFKIFYYHPLNEESNDIWNELMEMEDLYVIHIKRRNILRTLLSRKIAEKEDVWLITDTKQRRKIEERRAHFTENELREGFEQTREWEKSYECIFELKSMIEVFYEDLVSRPEEEFKKILSLLDLQFSSPETNSKKQNPEKLSQLITNYAALKETFANTEWSSFFED